MKIKLYKIAMIFVLSLSSQAYGAVASPVVPDYSDVFPTLSDVVLGADVTGDPAPWYVGFNLITPADIAIGVKDNGGFSAGIFTVTSIRLAEFNNSSNTIAFGTDTFAKNPFSAPIDQLVLAPNLAAGTYALAVSGAGGGAFGFDFITHLQVLPASVPLPASVWLLGSSLLGLIGIAKRKSV